jgi:hypothetical protein
MHTTVMEAIVVQALGVLLMFHLGSAPVRYRIVPGVASIILKNARLAWLCVGWFACLAGAISVVVVCLNPADASLAWLIAVPGGFLACLAGMVILHEMGHLLTAQILRLAPVSVVIGNGPTIWTGTRLGLQWTLKAIPTAGFVRVLPRTNASLRWRMILMVGSGPFVNGALAGLAAALIWMPSHVWFQSLPKDTGFLLMLPFFYVNALLFLATITPYCRTMDGVPYRSDGLQIIQLVATRG